MQSSDVELSEAQESQFPFPNPISTPPAFSFPALSHQDGTIPRTLRSPPRTPSIPPHGHRLFMIDHIAQICQRALELPAIDSLSRFAGVFEGHAEVGAVGAGGFALLDRGGCVADLEEEERISRRRIKNETQVMIELRDRSQTIRPCLVCLG